MLINTTDNLKPTIRVWLGGSFDPIHRGHLAILEHIYQVLATVTDYPIQLYLLPTAGSPLKNRPTDAQARLNMLALAYQDYPSLADVLSIDTSEIALPPPVYTYNTLQQFEQKYPDDIRIFVMGEDSLLNLAKWYRGFDLIQLAHLWVLPRADNGNSGNEQLCESQRNQLVDRLQSHLKNSLLQNRVTFTAVDLLKPLINDSNHLIYIDNYVPLGVSSSEIREQLHQHRDSPFLSPSVQQFIHQHKLYS